MPTSRRELLTTLPGISGYLISGSSTISFMSELENSSKSDSLKGTSYQPVVKQTEKITPDNPGQYDKFGQRMSLSGDTALIVGQNNVSDLEGDQNGSVYVFEQDNDGWTQQTKLLPEQGDKFGSSIVLEGDTALVANSDYGSRADHFSSGRIYVYKQINESWELDDTLSTGQNWSFLGSSMDMAGDSIIAGGKSADSIGTDSSSGKVFVFEKTGSGWDLGTELVPENLVEGEHFGESVAANNNTAIVGNAPTISLPAIDDWSHFGRNAHTVYVYERIDGNWENVSELFVDNWKNKPYSGEFGRNLSLFQEILLS